MDYILISSPLQGFTDFRFRNTFHNVMGGIDTYYAPYIRLDGKKEIKKQTQRDLQPANNQTPRLIPQVLTNNASDFIGIAKQMQQLGYSELNWNLGCPYPMVSKRGMGAGLLNNPTQIDQVLQQVVSESNIKISVKMRLGLESKFEIFEVLPILNKYPLQNIIIHPRIGKQLYKGEVDLDVFEKCIGLTPHTICYNGDINSVDKFRELANRFPDIKHWLIGRGLFSDPFLPQMIKNNSLQYPENKLEQFSKFHDILFHEYETALSGSSHLLHKMCALWEYFAHLFPNTPKAFKMIKKAKNIKAYNEAVGAILANG